MACVICETRRPKRFCPGVRGDICTICCGTEREVTVSCPLDCEYLRDARRHEKPAGELSVEEIPNRDVRVTEEFLDQHQELLYFLGQAIGDAALNAGDTIDYDVREALDSLIRTYRTLQSGVFYESVPANPLAANIFGAVQAAAAKYREEEQKSFGMTRTRDAEVLGLLVFLQRLELSHNNGRKRGRRFIDFLTRFYPAGPEEPDAAPSSLILP